MEYYSEKTIVYFDGNFLKANEVSTNIYGQSLHYGYAVFEGIRSYPADSGAYIFKAKEHYDRLRHSAHIMGIPFAYTTDELVDLTYELLRKNNFTDAYIRPLVICTPNMGLTKGVRSQLFIAPWEWGAYLGEKLLRVMTSSYARPNPSGFKIEAKVSGHYVNSILASQEAKDHGFDEALLLDAAGHVAEGPGANVFFEKNGVLYTPAKGNILPGITRATILELCTTLSIQVVETHLKPQEVRGADSAFFCGTAAEIVGMASLDNVMFKKPWDESLGKLLHTAYKCKVLNKEYKTGKATA